MNSDDVPAIGGDRLIDVGFDLVKRGRGGERIGADVVTVGVSAVDAAARAAPHDEAVVLNQTLHRTVGRAIRIGKGGGRDAVTRQIALGVFDLVVGIAARERGQVWMVDGVIADLMAFVRQILDIRPIHISGEALVDITGDDVEGGLEAGGIYDRHGVIVCGDPAVIEVDRDHALRS